MGFASYYTGSSADGFLADDNSSLDWLESRDTDPDGPLGYNAFIADVGAIVMGANTYQWVIDHDPAAWPYDVPAWIITHQRFATRSDRDIRFGSGPIPEIYAELEQAAAGRKIWVVGGGNLAAQFAAHDLLDEIIVSYAPVTLGSGIPLLPWRVELNTVEATQNGELVCVRYEVVRE
ncbi:dihydrofolate reductase family protein [Nocardia sp. NPDC003693]